MIIYIDNPKFKPKYSINNFPIYHIAEGIYFQKFNLLYLLRPVYHNCLPKDMDIELQKIPEIKCKNNDIKIIFKEVFNINDHETSCVYMYIINSNNKMNTELTIIHDDKEYTLTAIDSIIPDTVTIFQTSLFKDDYKNVIIHVDYYSYYHGIYNFLLYYNGDIHKIKDEMNNIKTDCNIYMFSIDYPYWKTFFNNNPKIIHSPHNSQCLQLAHSAIIANHCSDWLMNVDLDEYVDINEKIYDTINTTVNDLIIITLDNYKCKGTLCKKDYTYNYSNIIENMTLYIVDKSPGKYIERTRNKNKFLRKIHIPYYKYSEITYIKGIHLKCLSIRDGNKRYCVKIT